MLYRKIEKYTVFTIRLMITFISPVLIKNNNF
jgi:hypothetical protein